MGKRRVDQTLLHDSLACGRTHEKLREHVQIYNRRADGTETQEVACMKYALRPLNLMHGQTLVRDFGPAALKAVREVMVAGAITSLSQNANTTFTSVGRAICSTSS